MTEKYTSPRELENNPDMYMNVLERVKNGIQAHPRTKNKSIAIVGAGMAGLVSAWILHNAGFKNINVYEASSRVGGRVKTLRDGFTSKLHAEAGAMRIPFGHKLTRRLCDPDFFNLELIKFPEADNNTWVFINDVRVKRSEYDAGDFHFGNPYTPGLTAMKAFELTVKSLEEEYKTNKLSLDHISLEEYLRAFTKDNSINPVTNDPIDKAIITNADINLIGFEFGAADLRASLLEAYRDHISIDEKKKDQIKDGMDRLPQEIAKSIIDHVRYNSRVVEINREGKKHFKIYYENTVTHRIQKPETAEFVILAAPFSALTHVRLDQPLEDSDRLHAIRNLHYENATKIALEFSDRFWEDDGIHGGHSFTDLPVRWVYYPSDEEHPSGSERGILLASYTWGDDSLRWGSLSRDDRIRFALRDIAKLHDMTDAECDELFVGGMSYSWAEDEYTFGAFSLCNPHQEAELFDATWKPYKGIHFAGEHTSLKHAWIEGAVESGIRAACEIYQDATDTLLWTQK